MLQAFKEANEYVMPSGRYAGKTLAEAGKTLAGLRHLDWLSRDRQLDPETRSHLGVYLRNPHVRMRIHEARAMRTWEVAK